MTIFFTTITLGWTYKASQPTQTHLARVQYHRVTFVRRPAHSRGLQLVSISHHRSSSSFITRLRSSSFILMPPYRDSSKAYDRRRALRCDPLRPTSAGPLLLCSLLLELGLHAPAAQTETPEPTNTRAACSLSPRFDRPMLNCLPTVTLTATACVPQGSAVMRGDLTR